MSGIPSVIKVDDGNSVREIIGRVGNRLINGMHFQPGTELAEASAGSQAGTAVDLFSSLGQCRFYTEAAGREVAGDTAIGGCRQATRPPGIH